MPRRKKEPEGYHREQIAAAAQQLFMSRGVACTTMEEIAKAAGYSKATLYVYFRNKEEIVGVQVLSSMKMLHGHIVKARLAHQNAKEQYFALCHELVRYQEEFPYYFEVALGEINIDFQKEDSLPIDQEIFETGESINREVACILREGMSRGELRPGLDVPQTVFAFWASISGVILMAAKKAVYIETVLGQKKEIFLHYGFELLYRSIQSEERINGKKG